MPDASGSYIALYSIIIVYTGFAAAVVWCLIAWGGYRQLNGLTKRKSFKALMLTFLFGSAIGYLSDAFSYFFASETTIFTVVHLSWIHEY